MIGRMCMACYEFWSEDGSHHSVPVPDHRKPEDFDKYVWAGEARGRNNLS
jgi:hypothetical protein